MHFQLQIYHVFFIQGIGKLVDISYFVTMFYMVEIPISVNRDNVNFLLTMT